MAGVQDVHTEMAEAGLEEVILNQARTRVFSKLYSTSGIDVKPGGSDNVLEPDICDPHPYVTESES